MKFTFLLPLLASLLACTPTLKPEGQTPHPESVGAILLRIAPDNLDVAHLEPLSLQVAHNLASWGYAVDGTTDSQTRHTHTMQVNVGHIDRQGTPVGFSFGIGNSDPRSPDFQRAEVLPVSCSLESNENPRQSARITLRFVAEDALKTPASAQSGATAALWANHIGTACFNLLSDLRIHRFSPSASSAQTREIRPAWMPEVRIEVRKKTPLQPSARPDSGLVPPALPAALREEAPRPAGSKSPSLAPAEPSVPGIQPETREDEGRKQIIIHNQGSPVILEFGYERK